MTKIVSISLCIFLAIACHSTQKTADVNTNKSVILPDSIYRFSVSFISVGSGTDARAEQKFKAFVQQFNEKNKVNITPEIVNWGREGETDYCLKLADLNKRLQDKFIEDTKELLKSSRLIRYEENSICKTKRK